MSFRATFNCKNTSWVNQNNDCLLHFKLNGWKFPCSLDYGHPGGVHQPFFVQKMIKKAGRRPKILFLWGNDTDVNAICLWICFWGQRIHFWHQIWDLTNFTRNGGQKGRFLGQKWIKTLLPVNNRNVHRMSLEFFFVSRKMIFLHML